MIRWVWAWAPAIAQMAAIFVVSSWQRPPGLPVGLSSYTGHVLGYALLGALLLRAMAGAAWPGVTTARARRAVLFASLYGVSDEVHQWFVPGRHPSVLDWVADTAGAAAGVGLVLWLARRIRSRT